MPKENSEYKSMNIKVDGTRHLMYRRKVQKMGGSCMITIPSALRRKVGLIFGDDVAIIHEPLSNSIIITPEKSIHEGIIIRNKHTRRIDEGGV